MSREVKQPGVKSALEAVIFDMDGVLIDTHAYHFRSWVEACSHVGLSIDPSMSDRLRGLPRDRSLDVLLDGKRIPTQQREAVLEMKNRFFHQFLEDLSSTDILPGVLELLQELKRAGIRIGVASSSRNVTRVLKQVGITGCMETILDGGSVLHPKPAPDVFLSAAAALKVRPVECIVVEDGEAGVKAARAAGMCVVGVGPGEHLPVHQGYPDLSGVRLADLERVHARFIRKMNA